MVFRDEASTSGMCEMGEASEAAEWVCSKPGNDICDRHDGS